MATLGFSTKWPRQMGGGDTLFVPKIWKGIVEKVDGFDWCDAGDFLTHARNKLGAIADTQLFVDDIMDIVPKLHTMRKDPKGLWVPGRKIHMVVFNRTKNRFQFAPVMEVKAVQEVEIFHKDSMTFIRIDDRPIWGGESHELARNDGFESLEQFLRWFNTNDTYKLIHWTDLKY